MLAAASIITIAYTFAADTSLIEPHSLIVDRSLPTGRVEGQVIAARRFDTFWNTGDEALAGCGKSLNRDDSPPQGLKPSLVLHDLRGAKAPLYHSAAGFRDFFRSLLRRAETNT